MNLIKEFIISGKSGEVFAEIEINKNSNYEYEGIIIKNCFPKLFINLLNEFDRRVDEGIFGALDEIEESIYSYIPTLKFMNTKIYDLKISGNKILFFTKYPTGQGFVDKFPEKKND